jgi:serine/threonine protein kinase/Tol biopolymer transport system component
MTIAAGTCLGRYEIRSKIGEGGMGEVYRARDEKLNREVAIKVLPASFSQDADRLRRFEQEAKAAGTLNHPNILAVYDVGTHDGAPYVVSELLEGETLRDRLFGPLIPLRKVVDYAAQIARGLAAAHARNIVHRDLKPENIFISEDGQVKILDLGLAKLIEPANIDLTLADQPTRKLYTTPGSVVGTLGYMSPEQVDGKPVDYRSDIFSFGVVLYEMLTGKRAFPTRETLRETLHAIATEDPPDPSENGRNISPALTLLLRRCLEKNPQHRFHSASDLAFAIEALSGSTMISRGVVALPALRSIKRRELIAWSVVAAAVLLGFLALLLSYSRGPQKSEPQAMRFFVYPPATTTFQGSGDFISPDGRRLVFSAVGEDGTRSLWMRTVDSLNAQKLPGTEDASQIFWSPDSNFIGFFAGGKLKKMEASGGAAQILADAPTNRGGTWGRDGLIVFAPNIGDVLYRVSALGGPVTPITTLDASKSQIGHNWPYFLPDGRHFIYLAQSSQQGNSAIYVGSIDSKEPQFLLNSEASAAYAPPGYVLFLRGRTLMAQSFNPDKLQLAGDPVPIVEQIGYSATTARTLFSVSNTGVLAYRPNIPSNTQLVVYDRAGKQLEKLGNEGDFMGLSLSLDDKRIAVSRLDPSVGSYDLWIVELDGGKSLRLTFDQTNETFPVWSPDASHVVFTSNKNGEANLYQRLSNGAGSDELLYGSNDLKSASDWSSDGHFIVYEDRDPKTDHDLWVLPRSADQKPYAVVQTTFNEMKGRLSPDGKWIAYQSTESGTTQVTVQSFPPSGARWQVSTNGGYQPKWRRDGKELFYVASDKKLMVVQVKAEGNRFEIGAPQPLFEMPIGNLPLNGSPFYDVTRDGRRFIVSAAVPAPPMPMTVVLNWTAELKQ